jgi:hypothetical protein
MTESICAVLSALILTPALLESQDLTSADFPAGHERIVFEKITHIWNDARPAEIDIAVLLDEIKGTGAEAIVNHLLEGAIPRSPEAFSYLVSGVRRRRQTAEIVQAAAEIGRDEEKTGIYDEDGFARLCALIEKRRTDRSTIDIRKFIVTGTAVQGLEVNAAWTCEKILPERAVSLLHSKGGLGKTWLSLGLANAVAEGLPFLGLQTSRRPVFYFDFENPLPLLIARARILDVRAVNFWHLSAEIPPPKIDGPDFALFKQIPSGSLVIFDTLRAAHDGDENSSQDMALVMGRLKELREHGLDILLIHHAVKADERTYKGSTAISDLADHVLSLHRVRRGNFQEIEDDAGPDSDALFSLATAKTRFEPFHLHLSFNPTAGGFAIAADPTVEALDALADYIAGPGHGQKQGDIIAWMKDNLGGVRRETSIALLNRGEREGRWHSHRGLKGARLYEPPSCS